MICKKIVLLNITLLICMFSYAQTISIDPEHVNQSVTFGGDNKLTVKAWAEGNTDNVSMKLFQDMNLKILRVPIFALQSITDPIYDNVITVINSVKRYNPDVKIFASVANGDGYGEHYHGASKFPSGWTGCCADNVYRLNLTAYSAYLDSFMQRMTDAGITVDYLGPYNEDPGDDSDYLKIINQMTQLGNTEMVGVERWALQSSVDDVDDIEDRVSIVGSHFFDDETIPETNWESTWASLVTKSEDPVWYTESTRYSTGDNIGLLIAGMDNIFAPIRGGVEAVIFYQVCKRFVYANGSALPIKYSGFQNIVNNAEGKVITSTSNNSHIKVVTFGNNNTLDVHILNKNTTNNTVNLQLLNGFLGQGFVSTKTWTATQRGDASFDNVANASSWDITIPASSYTHLKIPLNKSILSTNEVVKKNQAIKLSPNPTNGYFQIVLPNGIQRETVLIKIFSVEGREVLSETRSYDSRISVTKKLVPGVYIISIKTKNNTFYNGKLIVK